MQNLSKQIVVLLPVYKYQAGLEKTLDSLAPDFDFIDIVVIDDGSVPAIHLQKFPDAQVKLIRLEQNKGIEGALNTGLEYIYSQNYKYVARIDAGDRAINHRFQKQFAFLESHPDHAAVGSWVDLMDETWRRVEVIKRPASYEKLKVAITQGMCFCHPAMMCRTEHMKQVGFYSYDYKAAEDYDYFYRMIKQFKIANLPESLLEYEMGNPDSITNSKKFRQLFSLLRIRLHHFDFYNPWCYLGVIRGIVSIIFGHRYFKKPKNFIKRAIKKYD